MAYNLLFPKQIITSGNMASASITSSVVEIRNQDNVGIQLSWTGVPVGTFAVQISINHAEDAQGNVTVAGDWVSLPLSPTIAAAGSADSAIIDLNQMSAAYVRVVYTKGSGTGTLNAYITAKGV